MSQYVKTPFDPSILSRVSESDVMAWMAARLAQIRSELPVHTMQLEVWYRNYESEYYDTAWTMHTDGECVLSFPSTSSAMEEVRNLLDMNPIAKAEEKRRNAKRLMDEADAIMARAEKGKTE